MAHLRLIATVVAALALAGLGAAAPASAELSAETMFRPETVVAIDLQLEPDQVAALEADPGEYVEGSVALAATGGTPATIGEFSAPLTVGVRLKGTTSFRGLDGKAAFKVKFDEFVDDQTFLGLEKLTLNNMVQDPSMLREALTYEAFHAAGIEGPRAGYAYVRLNGIDYGLHLNVETLDKIALEKRFGPFASPPQHLYEGEKGVDLTEGAAGEFEVDEGKKNDRSDLEALIAAATAGEPGFSARLGPVADLAQMTTMWAAERYLGHWDGYSGRVVNNYFLYSDAAGVFQMLPWGTDQTLRESAYPFVGAGGTLFEQCLAEPECLSAYREALAVVEHATSALDLPARAVELAARIAPWLAREATHSTRTPHGPAAIAAEQAATLAFLAGRPASLAAWLEFGTPPWAPGGGGVEPPLIDPDPVISTPNRFEPVPRSALPASLSTRIALDRGELGRGLLLARAGVSGPGRIAAVGRFGPAGRLRHACSSAPRRVSAGQAVLRCRLSPAARRRLAHRALTIRLSVRFTPADGGPAHTVERLVRLPRASLAPAAGA